MPRFEAGSSLNQAILPAVSRCGLGLSPVQSEPPGLPPGAAGSSCSV